MSRRCSSWRPKHAPCAHGELEPAACRKCWTICRNRVNTKGARCADCWVALTSHPTQGIRVEAARDCGSGLIPDIPDFVWDWALSHHDSMARAAAIGPGTPIDVLIDLSADESTMVANLARSELTNRDDPTAAATATPGTTYNPLERRVL